MEGQACLVLMMGTMNRLSRTLGLVLLSLASQTQLGAEVPLDTSFQPPDLSDYFSDETKTVSVSLVQTAPNGRIYVAAFQQTDILSAASRGTLFRLQTNGLKDESFLPVQTAGQIQALVILDDGRLVIGGQFHRVNGISRGGIARLSADGTLDPDFPAGSGVEPVHRFPTVRDLAVDSNGNILCAGLFKAVSGQPKECIVRIRPWGEVDAEFDPFVSPPSTSGITDLLVLEDDRIFVAGDVQLRNESRKSYITLLFRGGGRDTSFLLPPFAPPFNAYKLAAHGDGKVLSATTAGLLRFLPSGAIDPSFHPVTDTVGVASLLVRPDERIVAAGRFESVPGIFEPNLVQFWEDGGLDLGFQTMGAFPGSLEIYIGPLALQDDGKLLVGGNFTRLSGNPTQPLVRFEFTAPSSETLVQFQSVSDFAENGGPAALNLTRAGDASYPVSVEVVSMDESAIAGRDYTVVAQTVQFAPGERSKQIEANILDNAVADGTRTFQVYLTNGTANSISEGGNNSLNVSIHDDEIEVDLGGAQVVTEIEGFARLAVFVRSDPFIYSSHPRAFELGFRAIPITAEAGRDYSPATGSTLLTTDGGNRIKIAILDNRLIEGSRSFLIELLTPPAGVVLGERANVEIIIEDNDLPPISGRGANGPLLASAALADGKALFGGDFTFFDGIRRNRIARVHPDGSVDESWDVGEGFNGAVHEIVVQPDGKILVAGAFTEFTGIPMANIARLEVDGSRDLSFQPGIGWSQAGTGSDIWSLAAAPDGAIYIGSGYHEYEGENRPGLIRLASDGSLDEDFQPPILLTHETVPPAVYGIQVQDDGRILIAGGFSLATDEPFQRTGLMRLLPDGSVDPEFERTRSPVAFVLLNEREEVYALLIGPNSGYADLLRLRADGSRDLTFIRPNIGGALEESLLLSDDTVLLAGRFAGPAYFPFAVVSSNGLSVRREELEGAFPQTVVVLKDGSILAGAASYPPSLGHQLVKLSPAGAPIENLAFATPLQQPAQTFELTIEGQFKYPYYVEKSINLKHWFRVFTNQTPFVPARFQDPYLRSATGVFYRVRPVRTVP